MFKWNESEKLYNRWYFITLGGTKVCQSSEFYMFNRPANVVSARISNSLEESLRISKDSCYIPRMENTDFQTVTFNYFDGSTETYPFYIERAVPIPLEDTSLVIRNLLDNYIYPNTVESNLVSVRDWLQNNDFRCIYEIHVLYYALINCAEYYRHNPLIKNLLLDVAKLVVSKIETDIKHKYYFNELSKLFKL